MLYCELTRWCNGHVCIHPSHVADRGFNHRSSQPKYYKMVSFLSTASSHIEYCQITYYFLKVYVYIIKSKNKEARYLVSMDISK